MSYISPSTRKVNKTKNPEVETITNKKFWVLLNNKDKLFYHSNGHICVFSRRKDALDYLDLLRNQNYKIEKLSVSITR